MTIQLIVDDLSKSFINKVIINNFSYTFKPGCYCVTGPNGSGKTTLLEMIAGVDFNHGGTIQLVNGKTCSNRQYEYKSQLCFIPSKPSFFPAVTGQDFLNYIYTLKNQDKQKNRLIEYIEKFKLNPHLHTKFQEMSLGTQKKLFLCTLLMSKNTLIVLDEPTNGLDVESYRILAELMETLSSSAIVILSTHDTGLTDLLKPTILNLQAWSK